ncbi:MAG: flippase-like domain-containing protein, partial [Clostridiales bacterium]|nr:flippase-like domain-containing protein [Clostridiales bacterium]
PVTIRSNMKVALIGLYYSCITPFATGGQPMQVYYYHKDGVPYGAATSVLSVKFFCYQVASVGLSLIALLFAAGYIMENVPSAMIFIIIGFISNGSSIVGLLIVMLKPNLARRVVFFFVRLLAKLHIVKRKEETLDKLDGIIAEYFEAIQFAKKQPKKTLMVILMSAVQILCMMVVSYFIYQALGLQGAPLWLFICLQLLLYTAVSFIPMPGASGAQEVGFFMLFQGIFPQDKLVIVMVLWRFFTYYLSLCVGGVVTAADSVMTNVRKMLRRDSSGTDENS